MMKILNVDAKGLAFGVLVYLLIALSYFYQSPKK